MSRILTLPGLDSLRSARESTFLSFPNKRSLQQKWQSGFSMVELLVTMAILVIVILVAAPQFQTSSPTYEANGLYSDIEFARSSAIKSGQVVVVCASVNGTTCNSSTNWATGWIVLMPSGGTCAVTSSVVTGDQVLRATSALTSNDTATFAPAGNSYYCFNRMGYSQAANNGIVAFKKGSGVKQLESCVSVAGVGHAQVLSYQAADITGAICN